MSRPQRLRTTLPSLSPHLGPVQRREARLPHLSPGCVMSFQHHLLCSGRFPGGRGGPGGLWEIVSTLRAVGRDGQGGGTCDCQGRRPGWGPGNSRPRGRPRGYAVFPFMSLLSRWELLLFSSSLPSLCLYEYHVFLLFQFICGPSELFVTKLEPFFRNAYLGCCRAEVPSLFGTRGWFHGRPSFHELLRLGMVLG